MVVVAVIVILVVMMLEIEMHLNHIIMQKVNLLQLENQTSWNKFQLTYQKGSSLKSILKTSTNVNFIIIYENEFTC